MDDERHRFLSSWLFGFAGDFWTTVQRQRDTPFAAFYWSDEQLFFSSFFFFRVFNVHFDNCRFGGLIQDVMMGTRTWQDVIGKYRDRS